MKYLYPVLFGIFLAANISLVHAQPDQESEFGRGPGWMLKQLDLSPEQIKALNCETPGAGRNLRDEMMTERQELNRLLRNRSSSESEILAQHEKTEKKLAQWNAFRLQRMLKARSILSEEQFDKMLELRRQPGSPDTEGQPGRPGRRGQGRGFFAERSK